MNFRMRQRGIQVKYYTDHHSYDKNFPFDMYENHIPNGESSLFKKYEKPGELVLHNHDSLELNYVSAGEGVYYVGEETYRCKTGDVLIFNNYEYHGAVGIKDMRLKVITFDPEWIWSGDLQDYQYLKAFYEWKSDFHHILRSGVLIDHIATIFFEIEYEWARKQEGYRLVIKALLLKLLALIYRGFAGSEQVAEQVSDFANHFGKVSASLNYINENFVNHITLQDLADQAHMNQNYFSSYFKNIMGITPFQYINKKRIEYACGQLLTTNQSITEIAVNAGFHSVSYFNRVFKQKMKISPQSFRSSQVQQEESHR